MTDQTLEIEADSLEEASKQLQSWVSEDLEILEEKVLCDGKPQVSTGFGADVPAALAAAQSQVPAGAALLETKELSPEQQVKEMPIAAFTEQEAKSAALQQISKPAGGSVTVESIRLLVAGKAGFLGVGRQPGQYQVELLVGRPASVAITYQAKVKLSATLGKRIVTPVDDPRYLAFIRNCDLCARIYQETVNRNGNNNQANTQTKVYDAIWEAYSTEYANGSEFGHADFSGRHFLSVKFKHHRFMDCNFSKSYWAFSGATDSDFCRSNFSDALLFIWFVASSNFSACDFSNALFGMFDFHAGNSYEGANFTGAKMNLYASYFKNPEAGEKWEKFEHARMDNCKLTIKAETGSPGKKEIMGCLGRIFTPAQLAVMQIKYEGF